MLTKVALSSEFYYLHIILSSCIKYVPPNICICCAVFTDLNYLKIMALEWPLMSLYQVQESRLVSTLPITSELCVILPVYRLSWLHV
jgi:hypothetical protein